MPVEEEMMCVIHWFQSWSDLHKNDFMKDLIEKAVPSEMCGPESSSGAPYKVTIRVPQLVATYAGWHWATPI